MPIHVDCNSLRDSISSEEATSSKPWGTVIGATLLVNFATLSGLLLLLLPAFRKGMLTKPGDGSSHTRLMDIMIPSFAVGALMATAVFLVMPEALEHIGGGHDDHGGEGEDEHAGHDHRLLQDEDNHEDNTEGQIAAKFGCGVLGGFLLPVFLSIIFHVDEEAEMGKGRSSLASDEDECQSCKDGVMPQDKQGIATGVIVSSINSAPEYDADASVGEPENFQDDPIVNDFELANPEAPETKTKTWINWRLGASILIVSEFHLRVCCRTTVPSCSSQKLIHVLGRCLSQLRGWALHWSCIFVVFLRNCHQYCPHHIVS